MDQYLDLEERKIFNSFVYITLRFLASLGMTVLFVDQGEGKSGEVRENGRVFRILPQLAALSLPL
jgi:hypothetical protein